MKVSLNTIKQFTPIGLSVDELVAKINAQLGSVERVVDMGGRYGGAVIVRVVSCEKHPNADRLKVCKIDDNKAVKGVERDNSGYIQVVCGAPNVHTGMFVVWLPPSSTVPSSFTEKEPFVLSARDFRGVMSSGMLASPYELALGDSHEGLLELDPKEWLPTGAKVKAGASFASTYGLDDTVIEIENKMFTHRPDCFGQLGIAREIAGIQHTRFTSPSWYKALPQFKSGDGLELTVKNDASRMVPRFMAVAIKNISVGPSPVWLQAELIRLGGKPINNIVDVTNYIMLLTGQPMHAYDYDLLEGSMLGTRMAVKGETVTLLNKKTYQLSDSDIVIVDREKVIGLGGVMGGGNSEVSDKTTNIVLECATFDMYAIRKMSMRHGLFTDAVTRFNKGQSPLQNEHVLHLALQSVRDVAGGELASQVFDAHGEKPLRPQPPVTTTLSFINGRLGLRLTAKDIRELLTNVEFEVEETKQGKDSLLKVVIPFWRTDIQLPEDVVEEVGRLYGFDALPRELPLRSLAPAGKNSRIELKHSVRGALARAGANEVLTYSFVHERLLTSAEQDPHEAFRLSNALSPDLQYYRLSLLPSLLDKVHGNIKNSFLEFALFEIGKAHHKHSIGSDGLPVETELVELVYTRKNPQDGAAFYHVRRLVVGLCDALGIQVTFTPITDAPTDAGMVPYDHTRSALIKATDGVVLGVLGELKPSVLKNFKLPAYTAAATLEFAALEQALSAGPKHYRPLSKFPSVWQDLSLKVPTTLWYAELEEKVKSAVLHTAPKDWSVESSPLSIYQAANDPNHKTISLRFRVTSFQTTLTDKEVSGLLDAIAADASKLGAERI